MSHVRVAASAAAMIARAAAASTNGRETGGILLGFDESDLGELLVMEAGDPGPNAERRPTSSSAISSMRVDWPTRRTRARWRAGSANGTHTRRAIWSRAESTSRRTAAFSATRSSTSPSSWQSSWSWRRGLGPSARRGLGRRAAPRVAGVPAPDRVATRADVRETVGSGGGRVNDRIRPSASGARISGDAYQHTFSWLHALRLLRPAFGISKVGFEAAGVGNLDDLVVYHDDKTPRYHQLKFVATQGELLTVEWFMTVPPNRKQSPLQQFWRSFNALAADGTPPVMALQTNRNWDGNDALPRFVSGRRNRLVPRLADGGGRSRAGKVRRAWAEHLEIGEDELLGMLEHLALNAGRGSLEQLREECLDAQHAAGLRPEENVLDIGVAEVARLIGEGIPDLDADRLRRFVDERGLTADESRAVVLVQALDEDPWPESANVNLDWIDRFDGEEAATRRQLRDPNDWNAVLKPELRNAVVEIRRQGYDGVVVRGLMRLPVAFAVGHHLSDVAGFSLTTKQRGREWTSAGDVSAVALDRTDVDLGAGGDIAVAVSVANDLSDDVVAYLRATGIPARGLVHLIPGAGTGHQSVPDDATARGLARQIVTEVRAAVRDASPDRVHLFLSAPYGLALLLGHVWNRIPQTVVYEDILAGYAPTFVLG